MDTELKGVGVAELVRYLADVATDREWLTVRVEIARPAAEPLVLVVNPEPDHAAC